MIIYNNNKAQIEYIQHQYLSIGTFRWRNKIVFFSKNFGVKCEVIIGFRTLFQLGQIVHNPKDSEHKYPNRIVSLILPTLYQKWNI